MADAVVDYNSLDAGVENNTGEGGEEQQTEQAGETQLSEEQSGETQQTKAEAVSGKAIRDAVRAASEQFPDQAKLFKQLADTHFRVETAYKQAFPTPQEAITAKDLIEGIGGVEGAAKMQERISGYDQQDEALRTGSPEVLDGLFKDFPEGTAALAPHYLDRLAKLNPEALRDAVAPYAIGMLQNVNLGGFLDAIVNESDPARAKALAKQVSDWFKGQASDVQQLRLQGQRGADPRNAKLSEREQQLNQREEEIFLNSANSTAVPKIESEITREVEKIARQYKLSDGQKQKFSHLLSNELGDKFNADKTYLQQVQLRRSASKNDPAKVAEYIAGEYRRAMPDAALALAKSLYGAPRAGAAPTGVPKAGTPVTAPGGGPLRVSSRPPDSELDFNRPNAEMDLVRGRAYTKSGRYIAWR